MPGVAGVPDTRRCRRARHGVPRQRSGCSRSPRSSPDFDFPNGGERSVVFLDYCKTLIKRGVLDEVGPFAAGRFQEGAGDCIWDAGRQQFWAGWSALDA